MRAWLIFLVFVSSATLAPAQSLIDPDEFANRKNLHTADLDQLWRILGISAKIRETTAAGSRDTSKSFNCGPDDRCDWELSPPDWPLLDDDGEEMVVRVSPTDNYGDLSRFLVLHRGKAGWRLVDYLDSTPSRYSRAQLSIIYSGGKRWIVLTSFPRCGTGCSLNPAEWFELKNGKLRSVLIVASSGHEGNQNLGRYFEARFVRGNQSDGRETLEFIYHGEFRSGFGSRIEVNNLWGDEKVIRFSRPNGQGEFKFDPKNSEASEVFIDDIFSAELEVTQPRLFRLVQDHLLEIARGPKDRRRAWLKEVLDSYADAPELARVREAFASATRKPAR
jgi:hypothetical protein